MLISKFDLTFFSPHRKCVGFHGDYEKYKLTQALKDLAGTTKGSKNDNP